MAITPSDTDNFVGPGTGECDAIYVGGAGDVVVVLPNGITVTLTAVAGGYLWLKAQRVNSTSTTATALVALYRV